jgi:hypothetical protein
MLPIHIRRGSLGSIPKPMSPQQHMRKSSHGSIPTLPPEIFSAYGNGSSMMQGIQSTNHIRPNGGSNQTDDGGGIR